jgi:prolyl 4-hydroxylase
MATPYVAGIAALFVQLCIGTKITPTQALFETYIRSTAVDRGALGFDNNYGMGNASPLVLFNAFKKYKNTPPKTVTFQDVGFNAPTDVFNIKSLSTAASMPIMTVVSQKEGTSVDGDNKNLPFKINPLSDTKLFLGYLRKNNSSLGVFTPVGVPSDKILVRIIKGFLSPEECQAIKNLGESRVARSTVRFENGEIGFDPSRTSKTGFFDRSENQIICEVEKRATSLFNFPSSFSERVQILKYEPNQKYTPHYDSYGEADLKGSAPDSINRINFSRGYQRVASVFVYLSDSPPCEKHLSAAPKDAYDYKGIPVAGKFNVPMCSSTHFNNLKLSFNGNAGDAVVWTNTNSERKTIEEALHQGTALCEGSPDKWALNIWIHSRHIVNEDL